MYESRDVSLVVYGVDHDSHALGATTGRGSSFSFLVPANNIVRFFLKSTKGRALLLGMPMSCMPGYLEVINTHIVGSLTIPRASIKWV